MLTDDEIVALISETQSEHVERKASASDLKKIRQAVCAFANDIGNQGKVGVVLIGINDDGSFSGFRPTDQDQLRIGNIRSDGKILPFPEMSLRKLRIEEFEVLALLVVPSNHPPVRLDGRTWIRVGPRRAVATAAEEKRLIERRQWKDMPFDRQAISSASLEDLDLGFFSSKYLPAAVDANLRSENHRNLAEAMKVLGFVQRFGLGIQIARSECRKNGNPDPDFCFPEGHVLAVIRSAT